MLLDSGETMTFELSSRAWDTGPAGRRLTVGVDGSDRTLSIAGTGPMEGVRAEPNQRVQVDRLYRDISQKPGPSLRAAAARTAPAACREPLSPGCAAP